ncbi:hypothetical protein BG011_000517, partial [Mortierella polycephala]
KSTAAEDFRAKQEFFQCVVIVNGSAKPVDGHSTSEKEAQYEVIYNSINKEKSCKLDQELLVQEMEEKEKAQYDTLFNTIDPKALQKLHEQLSEAEFLDCRICFETFRNNPRNLKVFTKDITIFESKGAFTQYC